MFIADLHIHSHYSMATSNNLTPEFLQLWSRIKGIQVVATGDFTHKKWTTELQEKLIASEPGLFKLKPEFRLKNSPISTEGNREVHFMLSAEISSIYKKNNKFRKVHNLLYAPDFETVYKIQKTLSKIGNITSDGRPILGLDARDLLDLVLNINPHAYLIPAHIWTPWFSVLGDRGGFNSIEECFEDLSEYIFAVETGLSTNPEMNWMCSNLDRFALISNSDAHSPEKLGRNANIFNCEPNYFSIFNALKNIHSEDFSGTIDMFPQEGKYHYDGHRRCNISWNPLETLQHNSICPVCNKKVTTGVAHRVARLSDRANIKLRPNRKNSFSIIPLPEILSEIYQVSEKSKLIAKTYFELINRFRSEFELMLNSPISDISKGFNPVLAEAINRMRNKQVEVKAGFDGFFGTVKLFRKNELEGYKQTGSFENPSTSTDKFVYELFQFNLNAFRDLADNLN